MINEKRLIGLTQDLIRIPSENPGTDESRIAVFLKGYLENLGLSPKIYEFKKGRSNVVATIPGKDSQKSLLLSPHLDTVPAGGNWKFSPFKAVMQQGRIYGRGASDDKGNLAVALEVIRSLIEEGEILDYNIIIAATADEESGSNLGIIPLLEKGILKPQACLILDGEEFNIVVVQKGLIHLKVKLRGKAAHGAYPWKGINAIDLALGILSKIKAYRFSYRRHHLLHPPTINIGKIAGGDKVNVVADWCEFQLDIRFLPKESPDKIIKDIKRIIRQFSKRFEIEIQGIQSPYQIDAHHPIISSLGLAMQLHKIKPRLRGSEGATVISLFQDRGIPAVATGFGISGCAHSSNEYAKVSYLYKGAKVLEEFLKRFKFT